MSNHKGKKIISEYVLKTITKLIEAIDQEGANIPESKTKIFDQFSISKFYDKDTQLPAFKVRMNMSPNNFTELHSVLNTIYNSPTKIGDNEPCDSLNKSKIEYKEGISIKLDHELDSIVTITIPKMALPNLKKKIASLQENKQQAIAI